MWRDLASEVALEFGKLEGVYDLTVGGLTLIDRRAFERSPARREYKNAWERRKRASDPEYRKKQYAARTEYQRKKTMTSCIEKWQEQAKVICVGRDIPPNEWRLVLLGPTSGSDYEARRDFIYFLFHCKKRRKRDIATMLNLSTVEVEAELSQRVVK